MQRRAFVAAAAAAGLTLAGRPFAFAQGGSGSPIASPEGAEMATPTPETGYAPANGLRMYYEVHGDGDGVPLVVLHGAYMTGTAVGIAGMGGFVAPLAGGRFGYSTGGAAALRLAIQHPERVGKLVVASVASRTGSDSVYPEILAGIEQITPEMFHGTPFHDGYARVAPDPSAFSTLVEKLNDLDAQEFAWPDEDIRAIAAPTMVVVGDADIVRPEHATELLRLRGGGVPGDLAGMPNARLTILPGTSHIGVVQRADRLVPMISEFLDAPLPEAG